MADSIVIEAQEQLDALLDRHPYFRDRVAFPEQYVNAERYIRLKTKQGNCTLPDITQQELAQQLGISESLLSCWLNNRYLPRLIRNLTKHEQARREHEATQPPESRPHYIDPSTTYNTLKHLETHKHITPTLLATAIGGLYKTANHPSKIIFAELDPYHQTGPYWLRNIAKTIKSLRTEIEHLLNQHLKLVNSPNLSLRLAVVNHVLYLWHQNTNPDHWLNLYAQEHFYLDTIEAKTQLIETAQRHLNLPTNTGLSRLITQLTSHPYKATKPKESLSDLRHHHTYLIGACLHFLLDITNQTLQDFKPHIKRIGSDFTGTGQSGIHNPRFPTGQQLDEFRARAFAIVACDGHIHDPSRALTYLDKDPERIEYVKSLFRTALGEPHTQEDLRPSKVTRLIITVVAGRILERWGIPIGDKIVQQYSLHPKIQQGTPQVKRAYLEELTPEDGGFYTDDVSGWFEWKRAVILDAGSKNRAYNFQPLISLKHKTFIENHGKTQASRIRDESPRMEIILTWTQLQLLTKEAETTKTRHIAKELEQVIQQNLCQLLESEILLCERLGINISKTPKDIHLHETGRVSVIWKAKTHNQDDAVRWAILAPPSSGAKREAVMKWVNTRSESKDIIDQLKAEGLTL